jgi:GMP synthase-like glutamine amidotransferase
MSHQDEVVSVPESFTEMAKTFNGTVAAMGNDLKKLYGIQFHPEVIRLYEEEPLIMAPGQTDGKPFFDAYPGEMGVDFHLGFWKYLGEIYDLDAGL